MAAKESVTLELDGQQVRVSSPNKVFFAGAGVTKLELIEYYQAVREPFLAFCGGRATMMQRFPDGAGGKSFYQKRVPDGAPEWVQRAEVSTPNGTTSNALVLADLAHVAWAVNLGCLGFHVWPFRVARPEVADQLRIDLDPMPGLTFAHLREAAHEVHTLFDELGIASFPKTTGSRGIHIYARLEPRWTSHGVRAAAVAAARELERRRPDLLTSKWWKEERGERILVDYNQNAPHKTVFGAWSVRARVGAQVSTPFRWDELDTIDPEEWTVRTVPARLAEFGDPWAQMYRAEQSIDPLLELWNRDLAAGAMDAPWPPEYPKAPLEPPRVQPSRARHED